jgi:excinuclease ABC subunit C
MTDTPVPDSTPEARPLGQSLAAGAAYLKEQLKRLPDAPGVYRMLNRKGDPLYVGKARSLRKRVANYANPAGLPDRLRRMVAETTLLEVVTTHTEVEALLLEANLIKRLRPRYNVLLRDDKMFPYIHIAEAAGDDPGKPERWARLRKYRGSRSQPGTYYGPFASAKAVNQTLNALQRAFLLRSCTDAVFASRTRPCLLYQIKRCSAPCVGRIDADAYDELIGQARAFLDGRSDDVQKRFAREMEEASANLEFERAAYYRDRIRALAHIRSRQDINLPQIEEADVIAVAQEGGETCVQVFFFRQGRNYGNRAYYPRHDASVGREEVLEAFLGQFYDDKIPPRQIMLSDPVPAPALLAAALTSKAGRKVAISVPKRGDRKKLVEHAFANARAALGRRLAESATQRDLLDAVGDALRLDGTPERIEVYDNSHISGTSAVGAMVVAGPDGYDKNAYRKFNIKGPVAPGDDYAMMREVLTRRFSRALKEDPDRESGAWPDLVLIDGGRGQLNTALETLADLGIEDIDVVGVAKGPERDAGRETFYFPDGDSRRLPPNHPALYFLQRLRDEAHRFAIGAHRTRRKAATTRSALDDVPGIGARRKKALLLHFGSAREVARAGLTDLEAVDGISRTVAQKIYDHFHGES